MAGPMDKKRMGEWMKRLGMAGFLFFLVKGLVWIAIFAGIGRCAF